MVYLYGANCTQQRQVIWYRLDFNTEGDARQRANALKQISVDPGKQVPIGGNLEHLSQVDEIMKQLALVGGVGVEEFNRLPKNKQVVYLLSTGKPVPGRMIEEAHAHNRAVLRAQGQVRREQAAIGVNEIVERHIDATVSKFDVEMEQMPPVAGEETPQGQPLVFGAHVDHKATAEQVAKSKSARTTRQQRNPRQGREV
jgi:hypothetical protein